MTRLALALALAASLAGCKREPSMTLPPTSGNQPAPAIGGEGGGDFVVRDLRPGGELGAALTAELSQAQAKHLRPFLEVSATWCGPCQKLKSSMNDPLMQAAFKGTYIVRLDLDAWEQSLVKAGYPVKAVPAFFGVGDAGKFNGKQIDGGAWRDDVPAQMAPVLKKFFNS